MSQRQRASQEVLAYSKRRQLLSDIAKDSKIIVVKDEKISFSLRLARSNN